MWPGLCNFAAVDRLDLLASILNGRGRWTAAVAYEAGNSARTYPKLRTIPAAGWLGEPIEVTDDTDIQQIQLVRRAVFGGTDEQPLKHLGEAETRVVIQRWPELAGSWWISDDRQALRYARLRGITTRETSDLMGIAVTNGDLPASDGYDLLRRMVQRGRHLRVPATAAELLR
jgi:hypothetical protein